MDPSLLREGILFHLDHPVVFAQAVQTWNCAHWSLEDWATHLEDLNLDFRIGKIVEPAGAAPQWEAGNARASATLRQLLDWSAGRPGKRRRGQRTTPPFTGFNPALCWAYCAYKHLPDLLGTAPEKLLKLGIDWSTLGFPGRGGAESTLWVGTTGAHTLCHRDTYGCNLVVQLVGRKRWTLFPPSDSPLLSPTRVPYEESTVFSAANLRRPDLTRSPGLSGTHPHIVVLEPGDTLLVPRHWWHLVENLETSISINTWLELPEDDTARLEEALVKTLLSRLQPDQTLHHLLYNDPAEPQWPLPECVATLRQVASQLQNPRPPERRDKRAFWAAFRAWPGSRRVLPSPVSALLSPLSPTAEWYKSVPAGDGAETVGERHRPGPAGDGAQAASPDQQVFLALVQAVTDPTVVTCAAEVFLRALRQRAPTE